jgi:hypothetical protein
MFWVTNALAYYALFITPPKGLMMLGQSFHSSLRQDPGQPSRQLRRVGLDTPTVYNRLGTRVS